MIDDGVKVKPIQIKIIDLHQDLPLRNRDRVSGAMSKYEAMI